MVHHPVDCFLVAGNDARREHHRVTRLNARVLVIVNRRPRQGRHGLALRAADEHANFLRREIANLGGMNQQSLGRLDVAEVLRDLRRLHHGAADQRQLAPIFEGLLHGQLDAMDRGGETGDKQSPLGARENLLKARTHGAFAGRVTAALYVGGILKERQHSLLAVFGKGMQIEEAIVRRRGIDFEVAGVDYGTERRMNRQRDAVYQAVRDLDGIDGERADLKALASSDLVEHGIVQLTMLFQLAFHIGQSEFGAVNRNVQFRQNPGQRADVIFVAVGENNCAYMSAILDQVGNIGDDDVHAQQLGFREHEPGVNDDDVVAPANGHAIHAEFAESAEGYNLEFSYWHLQVSMLAQECRECFATPEQRGGQNAY